MNTASPDRASPAVPSSAPSAPGPVAVSLADAAVRQAIRYRLDSTLFVEAGAGSGKTTALVSRIVQLLSSGTCSWDSFAAITFTEAAALELKVRVRESLAAAVDNADDSPERDRAREALDHLDEAAISTIHGFCQRLLAEHPIEAGLPPRIEILDEVRQSLAWREQWFCLLDRLGDDAEMRQLFGAAALVGVTPAHLELLAREVGEGWDRCGLVGPDVAAALAAVEATVGPATDAVVASIGRALELESSCTDPGDRLLARLRDARGLGAQLLSAGGGEAGGGEAGGGPDPTGRLALLAADKPFIKGVGGNKASWECDIDDVRGFLQEAHEARERVVAEVCNIVLPALVATFDVAARAAAKARRAGGKLVFHDLLVLARDLLSTHPSVLEDVRRRVRYLLIDEFQDTDPLQLEIAELIGGGTGRADATGEPDAGRLFFVGDPQQSIYRFRGADPAVYTAAQQRLAPSGPVSLTSNFRSVPGILEFANECFTSLMGPGFTNLVAVRSAGSSMTAVHIVGGAVARTLRRHEQRVAESEACAAVVERAVHTGPWLVGDGAGGTRPARMSDVAILVPRRTGLVELEMALDAAGIGYRVESASLIYRSQEVRDLLALCKAIDDPSDEVALVAALRSPAFACRDDELSAFRTGGGSWSLERLDGGEGARAGGETARDAEARVDGADCDADGADAGRAVSRSLRVLRGYRDRRFELGPVGVLELAVRDRRLLQLTATSPRARESWRRVRFMIERARAFVSAGGGGLREFAAWVDEQLSEGLRSVESVLPEPDEDVVHILTVHAAKGLEFPIVVLAGFGTTDEARGPGRRVLRPADGGVEVYLRRGLATAGFAQLRADEVALERDEAIRVLYVAATRACDHLVICGHHVPAGEGSVSTLGQRLYEAAKTALERRPGLWESVLPSGDPDGTPDGDPAWDPRGGPGAAVGLPPAPAPARLTLGHRDVQAEQGSLFDMATIAGVGDGIVARRGGRPLASSVEDWSAWREDRDELLARVSRTRNVRATEVALLADTQRGPVAGQADQFDEPDDLAGEDGTLAATQRRGRGGTQLGRAVHATLQGIGRESARAVAAGLPAPPGLRRLAELHARAERIGDRAGEVERLVLAALSSPTVKAAFASGSPHREIYVAATIGSVVLDGYVDLCFEEEGGLTIVDYKTDTVRDRAEVEASAEHHGHQAAAYALALGDATGRPVLRCVLVFLSPPGRPIEFEVPDLAGAIERVRGLVEATQ